MKPARPSLRSQVHLQPAPAPPQSNGCKRTFKPFLRANATRKIVHCAWIQIRYPINTQLLTAYLLYLG